MMLTPMSRTPHEVGFRWIQLQAIGRHPLSDFFNAVKTLFGGGQLHVAKQIRTAVSHWRRSVSMWSEKTVAELLHH